MSIEQLRHYCELGTQGEHTEPERVQLLTAHRVVVQDQIAEREQALKLIDHLGCRKASTFQNRACSGEVRHRTAGTLSEVCWQTGSMAARVRNRCRPSELTDDDVAAAIDRIRLVDAEVADEAEHVMESLTWGEGPRAIGQSGLQQWLWYVVPTKYLTDEVGYMERLAETAAILFDQLELHGYAAICRSEETAAVHEAFDRSDAAGRKAMVKAIGRSGLDPPDVDDFSWSSVMQMEEAQARSAVEVALEEAMFTDRLTVGARGWRTVASEICNETLDGDHPTLPGQSWRTAMVTERIEQWVSGPERRSPTLARARAAVANRLLHPITEPASLVSSVEPLTWLLNQWGDAQPLTQAGYLKPAFVKSLQADRPWDDPFSFHRSVKTELDDLVLHQLRGWLQRVGAIRKYKATLRLTPTGRAMATDPTEAWSQLCRNLGGDAWEGFVAETALLFLIDADGPVADSAVPDFGRDCAIEMGWQTTGDGTTTSPSLRDVSWAFADVRHTWEACKLIAFDGDWGNRRLWLTEAGVAATLGYLRHAAAGPKDAPW